MTRIHVPGGTGYAGTAIVSAAAKRGHEVTSYSRTAPTEPVDGVTYVTGSVLDDAFLATIAADADVIVSALAPRGDLEGKTRDVLARLASIAAEQGVRFGVIGGAGSLLVAPGGPKVADTESFPDAFKPEAAEMGDVLTDLRALDGGLDWFYVSPAAGFGPWAAGEATGTFRLGDDVLLVDESGASAISAADLATAVVDEIETPAHIGTRFTVAY